MKTVLISVSLLLLSGCLAGRAGFVRVNGPQRAAFEMKCPEDQLKVVEINSNTVGVEGCGQNVVYKLVQTSQSAYDWVRD